MFILQGPPVLLYQIDGGEHTRCIMFQKVFPGHIVQPIPMPSKFIGPELDNKLPVVITCLRMGFEQAFNLYLDGVCLIAHFIIFIAVAVATKVAVPRTTAATAVLTFRTQSR